MKRNVILSPGRIALRKFMKIPSGVISLCFIVLCMLLAIFAYFIIPDDTPDANNQILEICTQKPGFTVEMLLVPKPLKVEKAGFSRSCGTGSQANTGIFLSTRYMWVRRLPPSISLILTMMRCVQRLTTMLSSPLTSAMET